MSDVSKTSKLSKTSNINNDKTTTVALKQINKMYDGLSYFDHYGGSVILFVSVTAFVGLAISYYHVKRNSQEIKDDWTNQRCNPNVIPFAGYINAPDGESASKYTSDNLTYCVNTIITDASETALSPIDTLVEQLAGFFTIIMTAIDAIRGMIAKIRKIIKDIFAKLLAIVMNFVTPLQVMVLTFKDIMGKAQGVMATTLYFILGVYYVIQASMGAGIEAAVKLLLIMVGVIAALWIMPFTAPAAAASTIIFLAISIPLAIITTIVSRALHIKSSSVPGLCFDKNTQIKMQAPQTRTNANAGVSTYKPICDIVLGDILDTGSVVTGVMRLSKREEDDMYNLRGVKVSGSHVVKHGDKYIKVCDHLEAVRLDNYTESTLYCLNTSDKQICIDDMVFTDWDELYGPSLVLMKNATGNKLERTDGGFLEQTKIEIKWFSEIAKTGKKEEMDAPNQPHNNSSMKISIKDVALGDTLKNGEVVLGIVKVGKYDTNMMVDYCLGGRNMFTGVNIKVPKTDAKMLSPRPPSTWPAESIVLYHLITDTGTFIINDVVVCDYNSLIDSFFENE